MSFVTTKDVGAVRVITYANAPFGTMTAAGAAEMYHAVVAAAEQKSVRVMVITGGVPGIFIRHYDVGELSDRRRSSRVPRPPRRRRRARARQASTRSRT